MIYTLTATGANFDEINIQADVITNFCVINKVGSSTHTISKLKGNSSTEVYPTINHSSGTLTFGPSSIGSQELHTFSSTGSTTRVITFEASGEVVIFGSNPEGGNAFDIDGSNLTVNVPTGNQHIDFVAPAGGLDTTAFSGIPILKFPNMRVLAGGEDMEFVGMFAKGLTVLSGYTSDLLLDEFSFSTGGFSLPSGMTITDSSTNITFRGDTGEDADITTSGVNMKSVGITLDAPGQGTSDVRLLDNYNAPTSTTTIIRGNLHLGSGGVPRNYTTGRLVSTGTSVRGINFLSGGVLALKGLSATDIVLTVDGGILPDNFSLFNTGGSARISVDHSTTDAIFQGGGYSYPELAFDSPTVSAVLSITGDNTFQDMTAPGSVAKTIQFAAASTTTFEEFNVNGISGNLISLRSSNALLSYDFVKNGTGIVSCNYLDIQRSDASPSTLTWYAGTTSTDSGNNTGWIFTDPPGSGSATHRMFMVF